MSSKALDSMYAATMPPPPGELPDGEAGDGAMLRAMAAMSLELGGVAAELRSARARAERRAGAMFYAPIQPIVLSSAAAVAGVTTFGNNEIWGPKTGYFWAIQRMAAAGLAPAGDSQTVQGTATSPGAFQTIATLAGLVPFANYTVNYTVGTSGTTGAPEVNNFRLSSTGLASIILNSQPGTTTTGTVTFQAGPSGNLLVTTGSNVATVAAVYLAELSVSSQPDNLNLYRGQPQINNFMNNLQLADPEWRPGHQGMILQPGDFITAQGTGLVGSPVAVNFDVIIGRLDLLSEYVS